MTITNDIKYVGVNDKKVDLFEGQYVVPNGMSYNSYIILDEKIAVLDSVDKNFGPEWISNIKSQLKGKSPNYLVVHHMEMDHSANIKLFTETFPKAKIVASKLPSWAENMSIVFPAKISLEQCSSEATALYKASLVSGESLVDLTGGFGVDCSFLSKNFTSVDYLEQNEELCQIAEHNFKALGLNIKVNNAESVEFLKKMPAVDCIYIDPARRDVKGKKTADLSLCSPNLLEIRDTLLEKCNTLLIKLSPMFDISSALEVFPECKQVHVVSVKNECKELLLILGREEKENIPIRTVNFHGDAAQERPRSGPFPGPGQGGAEVRFEHALQFPDRYSKTQVNRRRP